MCTSKSMFQFSAVGNVSDRRCVSDFRSKAREFDPGWSHTFVEIDHEIIPTASVDSESMCTTYWLTTCTWKTCPEKQVWLGKHPDMTIAVD